MSENLWTALIAAASSLVVLLLGGTGIIAWFKLGPERRQIGTETQGQIYKDLKDAYLRVCDDLGQSAMKIKACEAENEICRKQIHDLQNSVSVLQVEMGRQYRLSMLARARSHLAIKTLGNYELHIDALLDELRQHDVPITPMMRTQKLRSAYQSQQEKLEVMEAQELELLLKQQSAEESPT